jgi:UDP-N-acetylglucosamine 2-epimerase (non-hydrolysing)
MKIANIVGARPNFVKIAPILDAMARHGGIDAKLIHTGQHYDYAMNQAFFEDLAIPDADVSLGVGSGSHATQTAAIMVAFETWCIAEKPDLVLVVGDVNSTLACTIAARKLQIPVAHVEAGLRSGDMTMPEEINRRATDPISDLLFASEPSGAAHLRREGIDEDKIHLVGNVMIDTLFRHRAAAQALGIANRLGLAPRGYGVVTMHRPSNTDAPKVLETLLDTLIRISERLPLVFPMHPRTRSAIDRAGLGPMLEAERAADMRIVDPMRYLEFIGLIQDARLVLTDSGGLQEETSALGIPCLTMRENTERPITCELGTNVLIGQDIDKLYCKAIETLEQHWPATPKIDTWDGRAADRIVAVLLDWWSSR